MFLVLTRCSKNKEGDFTIVHHNIKSVPAHFDNMQNNKEIKHGYMTIKAANISHLLNILFIQYYQSVLEVENHQALSCI